MAQEFKNAGLVCTTSDQVVYSVPQGKTAIVIGCQVTNVSSSVYELNFFWTDDSESKDIYLAKPVTIPAEASYEPVAGKLVLEAGDSVSASSDANNVLEVSLSVLELE